MSNKQPDIIIKEPEKKDKANPYLGKENNKSQSGSKELENSEYIST